MEKMVVIMGYLVVLQIAMIFTLFLVEIGAVRATAHYIDLLYMEIITHPQYDKIVHIMGDAAYMVGGSVLGAGIYEYLIHSTLSINVLIFGIMLILGGAYIREKNKKG